VQTLTVIASPDTFGIADLDVSGILRIMVAVGKLTDYSEAVMAEYNKSGSFTFEYRGCWYGSDESWTAEGNTWYYVEAVRSIEQTGNLWDFVPTDTEDAPFLNSFEQPVYFVGMPFDISFIVPPLGGSPAPQLTINLKRYNAANVLLNSSIETVDPATLEGRVCSLRINPATIEATAAYMTVEVLAA
jgi:hypothetical protein